MRQVILKRIETSDEGTFGKLSVPDSGFECYTGELPDRNNEPGKSCIPPGVYKCNRRDSPKHGPCYHVDGVPNRTDIEIHPANWMGDESQGLKCQLLGCIAPGRALGELAGQKAVLSSKDALAAFEAQMEGKDFQLTIQWGQQ